MAMDRLTISGSRFLDSAGREVLLRGVNLGGSSKTPPDEPCEIVNDFSRHRAVSFVGRPFPAHEAREHYARLRHWGFNVLRFIVTWEAIEPRGYGEYDTEYLDTIAEMVALAGEYGFYVFIDPHQDVWSRMTGGDGAPGWTLEAVGFDISKLDLSEAAYTMQRRYPDYPAMIWPTNYIRLACATMFTLFFGGNRYAPHVKIDGVPAQDYLQTAFINSIRQVALRIKDMPHVLGYGPLNEPGKGYIGIADLRMPTDRLPQKVLLTPGEALLLGSGFPRTVELIERQGFIPMPTGETATLNPHGISAWKGADIWREVGVWDVDDAGEPFISKPDYFAEGDFLTDGLLPFTHRYINAIREIHPDAIVFLESTPAEAAELKIRPGEFGAAVNASHWYDVLTLFSKSFNGEMALYLREMSLVQGRAEVAAAFKNDIALYAQLSREVMGDIPTLIGEFGLAYDMNNKQAFRDGDYSLHELALTLYYDALDASLVHSTQWNYTPDNSNRWGDHWNEEDLSIYSPDQRTNPDDINSGGRAIRGFCRPYVPVAAGRLLRVHFDHATATFTAEIEVNPAISAPTEVYVPLAWYANGAQVEVSSGSATFADGDPQRLLWTGAQAGAQAITLRNQG